MGLYYFCIITLFVYCTYLYVVLYDILVGLDDLIVEFDF
jgi:hypothetical protein